jgi:hypothetical protein
MTRLRVPLLLLVVCLGIVAIAAMSYGQAIGVTPVTPRVVAGDDLGFRIEGMRGGTPVGRLVVRVNDRWVEADFSMISKPLSQP